MHRRAGRGRVLLLVFLALSIVLITVDFRQRTGGPLDRAKDLTAAIVAPIQRGFVAVFRPVGDLFSSLADIGSLREENEDLKRELDAARAEQEQADALLSQVSAMSKILDLDEPWAAMEKVAAQIIAAAPSNYKWAVTINKGSDDGIEPNMAVVTPNGLVGKTIRVTPHTSTVLLIIDPEGAASAKIQDRGETGLIEGNGGNRPLTMEFVDPRAEVEVGDNVVTFAYNRGIFPPGIPIGTVTGVSADERGLEADVEVFPAVDFENVEFVLVLLETGPLVSDAGGR